MALGIDADREEQRYHAAEVRRGMLRVLTGLASRGPVVLVFEDLHEADPVLLDLIEQLVKEARKVPLMVLCVARWEFLEQRPSWAGGIADNVTLWVEPLTLGHAAELAMEAGGLRHDDAERVAQHAGRQPVLHRGDRRHAAPRGTRPAADGARPRAGGCCRPTVQAVIATRIDQLSPAARELVRRASVFPRGRFDLDELSLLAEPRQELLDEAEDDELLVRDEERPGVWRFGSDVLRDVAYDSLAKRERQRLHLRVANKLSEGEQADRFPRTVAFHLEQAAQAALDLNPADRTLAERAVEALAHAGDIARRRIESRSAADLYERALVMAGRRRPRGGDREAWILSVLGEARYWLGEFDAAESSLHRALALGGDSSDRVCAHASRFLADITLTIRGDAAARVRAVRAVARRRPAGSGEPHVLARTLLMAGWVPFWANDLPKAEAMFREALEAARSADGGDPWAESRALVGIANVISPAGDEEEALRVGLEALAVGEDAGQAFTAAVAHETVAASLRRLAAARRGASSTRRPRSARSASWARGGSSRARSATAARSTASPAGSRRPRPTCARRSCSAATCRSGRSSRGPPPSSRASSPCAATPRRLARCSRTRRRGWPTATPAPRRRCSRPNAWWRSSKGTRPTARVEGDARRSRPRPGPGGVANVHAAQVWWAGRLFGPDEAGGDDAVHEARDLLERHHWHAGPAGAGSGLRPAPIGPSTTPAGSRVLDGPGPRMVASAPVPGEPVRAVGPVANPSLGPVWVDAHI